MKEWNRTVRNSNAIMGDLTGRVDVQVVVCDKLVCAVQEQVSSVPVPYRLYGMNY